jgi:hypothetical protein
VRYTQTIIGPIIVFILESEEYSNSVDIINAEAESRVSTRSSSNSGVIITEPPFNFLVKSAEEFCTIEYEDNIIKTICYEQIL